MTQWANILKTRPISYAFSSKLKQQKCHKIWKKTICKNTPKKQANFNYNKPKNNQPANLKQNPQLQGKTSPISGENRKVGNTAGNRCSCVRDIVRDQAFIWRETRDKILILQRKVHRDVFHWKHNVAWNLLWMLFNFPQLKTFIMDLWASPVIRVFSNGTKDLSHVKI